MISKILIANRGEIVSRVARSARKMGIQTVAVFSEADRDKPFLRDVDEAVALGGVTPNESYLNVEKIIQAAKRTGANAIHPGYGFLSERAEFAKTCEANNIIFIGPSVHSINAMGSKKNAKEIAQKIHVPTVPGYNGDDQSEMRMNEEAKKIGFPVLIKAVAGGGGKGMKIVFHEHEFAQNLEKAKNEAKNAFADDKVLLEKYFDSAKHIEVQILGDKYGNILHLNERECSVQRRYQKIIEEAPSPSLTNDVRNRLFESAVRLAKEIGYYNAGTIEYILDKQNNFYFLEVNTRLQVEHPVTEMITGLDLVEWQIRIAQGEKISFTQSDVKRIGHAMECRLYAENPDNNFSPTTGTIIEYIPYYDARFENVIEKHSKIDVHYDPMIAKIIVNGNSRSEAICKMNYTLRNTVLFGVKTNLHYLTNILDHDEFTSGRYDTKFLQNFSEDLKSNLSDEVMNECVMAALFFHWRERINQRPLKTLPTAWRNNFYMPQFETYTHAGKSYTIHYQTNDDKNFLCKINENEYRVIFIGFHGSKMKIEINGVQKTFFVSSAHKRTYVHHYHKGAIELSNGDRFPQHEEIETRLGYTSPMPGQILKVNVKPRDLVKKDDAMIVMVSMKMETTIYANEDGMIEYVFVELNDIVEADTPLFQFYKSGEVVNTHS